MVRSRLALLVGLLLSLAVPAHGEPGQRRLTAASLGPGVTHELWTSGTSTARVHLARIDAGSAASLRVVQATGGVAAGRETTTSLCRRTRGCVAALNGDFFTAAGPVGGVISDSRLLKSASPGHEQLSLRPLRATSGLSWRGVLRAPDGAEVGLDGVNVPSIADGVVVYTSSYGPTTPACTCLEVVLAERGEPVGRLGLPTVVARTGQATGRTPLPVATVVVAAAGAAAERLQAVAASGGDLTVTLSVADPTEQSLGVHPVLLRDGQAAAVDRNDPMLRDAHPRSVVAWDGQGTVWLAAFEGRSAAGPGPTSDELVAFLQRMGATQAVMLDGGGSTSLATADGPLSRPSDGAERPVSNALIVTSQPVAALRAAAPAPAPVPPPVAVPVVAPPRPAAPPPPAVAPPRVPPAVEPEPVGAEALPVRVVLSPTALDRVPRPWPAPAAAAPPGAVRVASWLVALATWAWAGWAWLVTCRAVRTTRRA